jgi:hypothetical protein
MRRRAYGVRRREKNETFLCFLLSLCLEPLGSPKPSGDGGYALSR